MKRGAVDVLSSHQGGKRKKEGALLYGEVVPDEIWWIIVSKVPFFFLKVIRQVNKKWNTFVKNISQQRIQYYFPYLKKQPDYQINPLKVFMKEYRRFQKCFPTMSMDVILSNLENNPIACLSVLDSIEEDCIGYSIEEASKIEPYALLLANGYCLPEGEMNEQILGKIKNKAILLAACNGSKELFNLLALPGITDIHQDIAFINAANQGHLEMAEMLLALSEISAYAKNKAFRNAAKNGHLDMLIFLLPSSKMHDKEMALCDAASQGHLHIVNMLLAEPDILYSHQSRAFREAALYGHLDIVNVLINIPEMTQDDKGGALRNAAQNGHIEIVNILIALDEDEISLESKGWALRYAAENGHLEIVNTLLALPNMIETHKWKALELAKDKKVIAAIKTHLCLLPSPLTFSFATQWHALESQDNAEENELPFISKDYCTLM